MRLRSTFLTLFCFALSLSGCGKPDLHLQVRYKDPAGLEVGAPVVAGATQVGAVESIRLEPQGSYLVGIAVGPEFTKQATVGSKFFIDPRVQDTKRRQITLESSVLPGTPLQEGEIVDGSERAVAALPWNDLIRQFSDGLKGLRGQLEQFQEQLRRVPNSEEAKRLDEEWRRLAEEVQKAQSLAQDSVKKDLMPKLQRELERFREQLERPDSGPGTAKNPAQGL